MEDKPSKAHQVIFSSIASIGGFVLGNISGWSSTAERIVKADLNISTEQFSWIGSCMPLAAAFAQVLTAGLLLVTGRKLTFIILAMLTTIGWTTLVIAMHFWFYILGRTLLGLFAGGFSVVVPIFVAEITDKSIRGLLGVFFQLFWEIGILYSYAFAYLDSLLVLNLTCTAFPAIICLSFGFARESPVYLYKKNKVEAASASLQYYRGRSYNIDSEIKEIENLTKAEETTFYQSFKQRSCIRATVMLFGLHTIQQLCGINIITFYAHNIFERSNTSIDHNLSAVLLGVVQSVTTGVAAVTVDRIGRKVLLYVSLTIMTLCLFGLGIYFTLQKSNAELASGLGVTLTVCVCIYTFGFSIGIGPLPWAMLGEVLPTRVKSEVGTAAAFINWFLAFLTTVTFPLLVNLIGVDGTFYVYAIFTALGLLFVIFFVIETKNKSLDEIQKILQGTPKELDR